jgi:hypothetical protein
VAAEESTPGGRTRGIGHRALAATNGYARLYEAWRRDGLEARVTIDAGSTTPGHTVPRVFVGIRSGLHRGRPEEIGTWQPVNKTVSFAPEPRRVRTKRRRGEMFVRTLPAMNDDRMADLGVNAMLELSAPYRRLARKDAIKDLYHEQPDPVDGLAALGDDW